MSAAALRDIVRPVMLAAGVPAGLAHPHVPRHTYGTLFMTRPNARIEQLQTLMGHADLSTTSVYLRQTAHDLVGLPDGAARDQARAPRLPRRSPPHRPGWRGMASDAHGRSRHLVDRLRGRRRVVAPGDR